MSHTSPTLSEIGNLFLSGVRQRQTKGAALPTRQPPTARRDPVMVTLPLRERDRAQKSTQDGVEPQRIPPVSALLSSHLGNHQRENVCAYARHLAARGQCIGLIELESAEFRITRFEKHLPESGMDEPTDHDAAEESFDLRKVREALHEMSWDIDRWLLLMPAAKALEAKCLLRDVSHWVLLGTCDHDGVISCYRTLKGLNPGGEDWPRPRLTLALLDCADESEAHSVHRKLAGVCQQFLGLPLEPEAQVAMVEGVIEHNAMFCRIPRSGATDKGAAGPHWQVIAEFVAKSKSSRGEISGVDADAPIFEEAKPMIELNPISMDEVIPKSEPTPMIDAARPDEPAMRWTGANADTISEVIDLPDSADGSPAILGAVLRSESTALIECPIVPPMCPQAKLAVTRDRRLMLLAVGQQGLTDLRLIGRGYQWLCENRSLIAMALPQMAIDASAMPQLRLLIDHADMNASALQPMLQAGMVSVQAYRRLRWGQKTGLLLEAA